ncbi:MAG: nucleotidyltransferase domain-containing protein [Epsilonproteobacteria bacterium]|nr:nucleotidyltransferase domain-containing protein [Campylobacterota bacterium]
MRLKNIDKKAIRDSFFTTFGSGKIYLFGSRVNDSLRGGDIDLYLITDSKENLVQKKVDFLVKLKRAIGEQKIDVVISRDSSRVIEQEALKNGILINEI